MYILSWLFYFTGDYMERYSICSLAQKEILDKLFEYLGFNEVTSFEDYIEYIFKNAKQCITFEHIVNHAIRHIVTHFWREYPQYHDSKYVKYLWLSEKDMIEHFSTGSSIEFDPKGIIRLFIKDNFYKVFDSKR